MEQIKELTKRLIANSFKELMLQTSFDKITIKMITDHANVIRPTFYNHFHDKYELVEWITRAEILDQVAGLIIQKKGREALLTLFAGFVNDRVYYHKAFEIEGQNSFYGMLLANLSQIIMTLFKTDTTENRLASSYYANGLITFIRFAMNEETLDFDTIVDMYIRINTQLYEQLTQ